MSADSLLSTQFAQLSLRSRVFRCVQVDPAGRSGRESQSCHPCTWTTNRSIQQAMRSLKSASDSFARWAPGLTDQGSPTCKSWDAISGTTAPIPPSTELPKPPNQVLDVAKSRFIRSFTPEFRNALLADPDGSGGRRRRRGGTCRGFGLARTVVRCDPRTTVDTLYPHFSGILDSRCVSGNPGASPIFRARLSASRTIRASETTMSSPVPPRAIRTDGPSGPWFFIEGVSTHETLSAPQPLED
jgi:hypothetical protein